MCEKIDQRMYSYEEVLSEIEKHESNSKSWLKNLLVLIISLFIFFRLGLLKSSVNDVLIIILVLLVHEVGHCIGMRLFGYGNIKALFIPFAGAVVSGENQNVSTYKKATVSLLGPAPGIFLGIFFLIVYVKTEELIYLQLMIVFLLINSFNLLPFLPLDGGQFLYEVLFSRSRYIELVFRVLASISLIITAYFLDTWLLGLLGLVNLVSVIIPFKLAGITKDVRRSLLSSAIIDLETISSKSSNYEAIPPEVAKEIIKKVQNSFTRRLDLKTVARYTNEIWERISSRPPGIFATLGLLCVYLLCFSVPFMSLIGVSVISQIEKNPFTHIKIVEYKKQNGEMGQKQQIYSFGKLISEIDIDTERLVYHGRGVSYRQDGTVSKEGTWTDGKWDGEWKEYDQYGNLIRMTIFNKGKFILRKEKKDDNWIEKDWADLPSWLRKAIIKHNESPPLGPKRLKRRIAVSDS